MINNIINRVKTAVRRMKRGKKGQTLVEYALILAFISVVAIAVLIQLGRNVASVFSTINSELQNAQVCH
jgi:Flp pilus assembly pilin Flp